MSSLKFLRIALGSIILVGGSALAMTAKLAEPTTRTLTLFDIEQELAARTNAARVSIGLKPLIIDQTLINFARYHTWKMANEIGMVHSGGPYRENIAMGMPTSAEVMKTWLNSSGHYTNIMSESTRMGAACYISPGGTLYWTQEFK